MDQFDPAPRRRSGRPLLAFLLAAVIGGSALVASVHLGWIAAPPALSFLAPETVAPPPPPAPISPHSEAGFNARIDALDQKLSGIEQQAGAVSGEIGRAEALMVAFAARRAIERGQPLGYLEGQLQARFGQSQPQAVRAVIDAGAHPVTLQMLGQQLAMLDLTSTTPEDGAWARISQELGEMFVIRHDDSPSPDPHKRMERARLFLEGGNVEGAVSEVIRTPGRGSAGDWLRNARTYIQTQQALDAIETAALLAPGVAAPPAAPQPAPATGPEPAPGPTGD